MVILENSKRVSNDDIFKSIQQISWSNIEGSYMNLSLLMSFQLCAQKAQPCGYLGQQKVNPTDNEIIQQKNSIKGSLLAICG